MNTHSKTLLLAALVVALGAPGAASAAVVPLANVVPTAVVNTECNLVVNASMAFGQYDPVTVNKTANLDAESGITVRCTKGTTGAYIGINQGLNGTGVNCLSYLRRLKGVVQTTKYMNYGLYRDAARTQTWLCQPGSNTLPLGTVANNLSISIPIYGRMPAGQSSAVSDSYSDQVSVTVTF